MRRLMLVAVLAGIPIAVLAQTSAVPSPFIDAHQKLMAAMMGAHLTGDADRDFVTMMIPHHQGAIDMARVEVEQGKDPAIREMAQRMIDAQQAEVAAMQAWIIAHP